MTSFTDLLSDVANIKEDVLTWRRHLHQHPQLSFHEKQTSRYITEVLTGFGCPHLTITHPVCTAVVADLKGGAGDGPIVALRADFDALPLNEETDLPFRSVNKNVMHACGHDAHTSMLLGAAKVLCDHWKEIKGIVRFIFQHAEENPPGGARELVAHGVMDNVKYVYGQHVHPLCKTGEIALKNGVLTSCSDSFTVVVKGRGGHASTPHLLIDPVPIAAEVVMAIQTIVSRKVDSQHAPVVSIPTMTTGPNESHNVIPDEVKLMGTIRSFDRSVRQQVHKDLERIVKCITEAHGASYTFELILGYDMVENDPKTTDMVRKVAKEIVGENKLKELEFPLTASEDFSKYEHKAPGTFPIIGIANKSLDTQHPPHSCHFRIDEDALPVGVSMHVGFVHHILMN